MRRFILFHDKRHPIDMGADEIRAFLTHLAVHGRVAASTQNGALNALLFLYGHVLRQPFPDLDGVERTKRPRRLPTVFTSEAVQAVLMQLNGTPRLMAGLLHGAGLRVMECVRLRVKDIDFAYHQITVRDGKGAQDRVTVLPESLQEPLQHHLAKVKSFTKRTCKKDMVTCTCRTPLNGRILKPVNPGSGNRSFRRQSGRLIHARVSSVDTMCRRRFCTGR